MHEHLTVILAGVMLLGAFIQWISWWIKVPAILGLLVAGIILGPVTGSINPDDLFGEQLFSYVSLGVAVVLFEGALTLRFSEIRHHGSIVTNLVTWGAVISWLLMGAGVYFFTDLGWPVSLLFSALVVVTGPTVIVPLLRTVRPNQNVSNILRWEGILIDPLGALFVVFMFEFLAFGAGDSLLIFFKELVIGIGIGGLSGVILGSIIRRHLLPEYLQNVFILGFVVASFAFSNYLGHEAGLIAVTIMGIYLANTDLDIQELLSFKETLSVIIISVLFIFLAARIQFSDLEAIAPMAIPILLVVLLARPVIIALTTWRSSLTWQEKVFISWVAPRGIVAAAVSSLFAIKLAELGTVPNSDLLPALVFMVIVVTVFIQSISSRYIARWLGVAEAEPRGVLIVGANPFARELGKVLKELDFTVQIASQTWSEIHAAKMAGLPGYLGNPVSTHADRNLDLAGIGFCVALSRRPELNMLVSMKFRNDLGRQSVFSLVDDRNVGDARKGTEVAEHLRIPQLFGAEITLGKLLRLQAAGAAIKVTTLTDEFTESEYEEHYGDRAVPLLCVDDKKKIQWFTTSKTPELKTGYALVSLIMTEQQVTV